MPVKLYTVSRKVCTVVTPPKSIVPPNSARRIEPSASTSIEGIPETSLTEKIVPVKSLVIENS